MPRHDPIERFKAGAQLPDELGWRQLLGNAGEPLEIGEEDGDVIEEPRLGPAALLQLGGHFLRKDVQEELIADLLLVLDGALGAADVPQPTEQPTGHDQYPDG